MNYLKRAWLSVTRRKGKSLLLFTIIFILGNVIAGAVSIQQATTTAEKKVKSQMGATATIQLDYQNMTDTSEAQALSKDIVTQVGELSYVKYYDYVLMSSVGSETLEEYIPSFFEENESGISGIKNFIFNLRGVQSSKVLPLEEGEISLVDGRNFTDEEASSGAEVALISKELAEKNNLNVGDTATLTYYEVDSIGEVTGQTDYPVEVIGIYQNKTSSKTTSDSSAQNEADEWERAYNEQAAINRIFVPNKIIEEIRKKEVRTYMPEATDEEIAEQIAIGEPLYVLKNPEDVDKFKEEAQPLLPENYVIFASSDTYDSIAAPIQSMSKLAGYVLIVAIIATVTIITLVVLLFLRDRKHELGIYLSLGEAKWKVVAQTLVEVFVIAFAALSLSVVTGNLTASAISDTLIESQTNQNDQTNEITYVYSPELTSDATLDDVLEEYEITLSAGYILIMYAIGLGTVLVATIIPTAYIVRLNPKRIMM